jgi:outer membrane protein assembly factor BamB
VTNRCEVVALDLDGMADGNDGFQDEARYVAGPGRPPRPIGKKDADILWRFDMRDVLGVFPHNVASSSVLLVGDRLYATTSNGTDWSHLNIPAPFSPSLVALDRKKGGLLAEEASGISERTMHSNWSSPGFVPPSKSARSGIILFGGGDGFLYGFDPRPSTDKTGLRVLTERWRFDANAPGYRTRNGKPIKYATGPGPSEIIGTPVHHKGTVYVSIGQDPEHGGGVGRLSALNPHAGKGDITEKGRLWTYDGIRRSISTVAVGEGLVFAADYDGVIHCLDARTGKLMWTHDTLAHIWGSPLLVDGKVYVGNEDGTLTILEASRTPKVIRTIDFPAPIYSSPVVSNGALYIATQTHLYAIDGGR